LIAVKISATRACFTRPENKVERVSYPVMTPSAARGTLEAIFWKPEFAYRISEIHVLKPIRYQGILRNEVGRRAGSGEPISITDDRQQRNTLALYEVEYVIKAYMVLASHATDPLAKYIEQFERRVAHGQCFSRPYLGCREFACDFEKPNGEEIPISEDRDLGLMLFDISFRADKSNKRLDFWQHGKKIDDTNRERTLVGGTATPLFFDAKLEKGVLRIPQALYEGGTP
jgi:CRISPR-associated protein Cas5d